MKINKAIETPAGVVKFDGEITDEELAFVLEVGLVQLITRGIMGKNIMEQYRAQAEAKESTVQ